MKMSNEQKIVPQIRFAGFTDDWNQRKIGDYFSERTERSGEGELLSVTIGSGVVKFKDLERHIISSKDKSNYKVVKKGDIAYNSMRMWQGSSGHSEFDGIVSPAYTIISPNGQAHATFFAHLFKRPDMIQTFQKNSQGLTSDTWNLKFPTLSNIVIYIPEIEEQIKITDFLSGLDNAITNQKRKLDGLKKLKKAYLQKMFPQVGESVPKVRFDGFDEPWKVQRLGDLAEFSKGSGYSKNDLTTEGVPIILYGRLYTKYETVIQNVDTFVNMREKSIISCGGEVIIPSSGETSEDIARASVVSHAGVILGGDLNIIRPNSDVNPVFLVITISNGQQQKELIKRAQGKSVVHISNSDLMEVTLLLPSYTEQYIIGNFFTNIDIQLTAQAQKLKQLKKLKAAYLQKIFV